MELLTAIRPITWWNIPDHWYGNWYVALPPGHKYHWVHYDDIPVVIHWGYTYSDMKVSFIPEFDHIPNSYWVVWFDTLHYWDNLSNCSKEFVETEVLSLKKQLEL